MSRLQPWHAAVYFLKNTLGQRPQKAAAILTAGGKGNQERAYHHLRAFFKMLNARGFLDHLACSPKTDTLEAEQDEQAKAQVRAIAAWLNSNEPAPEYDARRSQK